MTATNNFNPPPESQPAPPPEDHRKIIFASLLLLAVFLVYRPALNGAMLWDDEQYMAGETILDAKHGLHRIWFELGATAQYYPLTYGTFWAQRRIWGESTTGYHLLNIFLHGTAAILLWAILLRLSVPGALFIAALFALHPVYTESVAWISELKNSLSGCFYLAALYAYLGFDPPENEAATTPRRWGFYALSFFLFILALLSKTVTCSLPAVLVLLYWWRRSRLTMRMLMPLLPLFALGGSLGLLTARMEKSAVHAVGADWDFTFFERVLIAGRALFFYLEKLLLPRNLTFIYPRWKIDAGSFGQIVLPILFVGVLVALWGLRKRLGKGPLAALLMFSGTLFPALGFFNLYPMRYSFVADHFQYLASIPILVLLTAGLQRGSLILKQSAPRARISVGIVILALCGWLTWRQARVYQNKLSLWTDTYAKNPDSFIVCTNYGAALLLAGREQEAIVLFKKTLRLRDDTETRKHIWFNLGVAYLALGDSKNAETYFRKRLTLSADEAPVWSGLGRAYAQAGHFAEAILPLQKAVTLAPRDPVYKSYLAAVYLDAKKPALAIQLLRAALRLEAKDPRLYCLQGRALADMGQADKAEEAFRNALKLAKDYAEVHCRLGILLLAQGRTAAGVASLQAALRLDPTYSQAREALAAQQKKSRQEKK